MIPGVKTKCLGVLLPDGQWLIWPVMIYDDGYGGNSWPMGFPIQQLNLDCKFYKKSRDGFPLYKAVGPITAVNPSDKIQ